MTLLDLDDLGAISGGVIVETDNRDRSGRYAIVDDESGEVIFKMKSHENAKIAAVRDYHTSDELISPEEYRGRFGKPIGSLR